MLAPAAPAALVPTTEEQHHGLWDEDVEEMEEGGGDGAESVDYADSVAGSHVWNGAQSSASISSATGTSDFNQYIPRVQNQPGFSPKLLGDGISARSLHLDIEDYSPAWALWPDHPQHPCPVRVENLNIAVGCYAPDAEDGDNWATPADPDARARVSDTAALLGLQYAGLAKGVASGDHHEAMQLRASAELTDDEIKEKIDSMEFSSYIYAPITNQPNVLQPMFRICAEALYDPTGQFVVAIRYWKHVYDPTHSTTKHVAKVMQESLEVERNSCANSMSHRKRKANMQQVGKQLRHHSDPNSLEVSAPNMYMRLTNIPQLISAMSTYAGGEDPRIRAPLLETLPPCCELHAMKPHKTRGSEHPLSFEWACNSRRPDGLPLRAGLIDERGVKIKVHPSQLDPANYWDEANGSFRIPEFVRERNAFKVLLSPTTNTPFAAPLPFSVSGSLRPADCLLELYYERMRDQDVTLQAAMREQTAPHTWDMFIPQCRMGIRALMTRRSAESADHTRKVLRNNVRRDTMDASLSERLASEHSVVSDDANKSIDLEPRQTLKDMSGEISELQGLVDAWRRDADRKIKAEEDALSVEAALTDVERFYSDPVRKRALKGLVAAKEKRLTALTRGVVDMGLQMFQACFESKRKLEAIPPGWRDAYKSLVKEIAGIGTTSNAKMRVDPEHPNRCHGTASLGFALGLTLTDLKRSAWGQWRSMQFELFSHTACVDGRDVRIMLDGYLHSFESFMPSSYLFVVCGGAGCAWSCFCLVLLLPESEPD